MLKFNFSIKLSEKPLLDYFYILAYYFRDNKIFVHGLYTGMMKPFDMEVGKFLGQMTMTKESYMHSLVKFDPRYNKIEHRYNDIIQPSVNYYVRNMKIVKEKNNTLVDEYNLINVGIEHDQFAVLYRIDDSRNSYIISDYYCKIRLVSVEDIIANINKFPDVQKYGNSIRSKTGTMPVMSRKTYNELISMIDFDYKAPMLHLRPISWALTDRGTIALQRYKGEPDKPLVIPSCITEVNSLTMTSTLCSKKLSICDRATIVNVYDRISETTTFGVNKLLEEMRLGNNIKVIAPVAFQKAPLKKCEFNKKLEVIGDFAFESTRLGEVKIQGNLSRIGKRAFADIGALEVFDIKDTKVREFKTSVLSAVHLRKLMLPSELKTLIVDDLLEVQNIRELYIPKVLSNIDIDLPFIEADIKEYAVRRCKTQINIRFEFVLFLLDTVNNKKHGDLCYNDFVNYIHSTRKPVSPFVEKY